MQLNVLYFAHARERVGLSEESVICEEGTSVEALLNLLAERHQALGPLTPYLRVAVNGAYADPQMLVPDHAEVALIPPVSGGIDIPRVLITQEALDVAMCRAAVLSPERGALVCFEGIVRDHARGRSVTRIDYEAYPSMAVSELQRILEGVEAEGPSVHALVHHRVGSLEVGEVAVIVAVGSPHRAEAFEACQALIDRLKQSVPIWKHEHGPDGATWVSDRP